ncbi:hypothetical protein WI28_23105 [Burkholderia diffusa]|nr:hypothetical protein WI28_23105 [Burkholderia diffusa]
MPALRRPVAQHNPVPALRAHHAHGRARPRLPDGEARAMKRTIKRRGMKPRIFRCPCGCGGWYVDGPLGYVSAPTIAAAWRAYASGRFAW